MYDAAIFGRRQADWCFFSCYCELREIDHRRALLPTGPSQERAVLDESEARVRADLEAFEEHFGTRWKPPTPKYLRGSVVGHGSGNLSSLLSHPQPLLSSSSSASKTSSSSSDYSSSFESSDSFESGSPSVSDRLSPLFEGDEGETEATIPTEVGADVGHTPYVFDLGGDVGRFWPTLYMGIAETEDPLLEQDEAVRGLAWAFLVEGYCKNGGQAEEALSVEALCLVGNQVEERVAGERGDGAEDWMLGDRKRVAEEDGIPSLSCRAEKRVAEDRWAGESREREVEEKIVGGSERLAKALGLGSWSDGLEEAEEGMAGEAEEAESEGVTEELGLAKGRKENVVLEPGRLDDA